MPSRSRSRHRRCRRCIAFPPPSPSLFSSPATPLSPLFSPLLSRSFVLSHSFANPLASASRHPPRAPTNTFSLETLHQHTPRRTAQRNSTLSSPSRRDFIIHFCLCRAPHLSLSPAVVSLSLSLALPRSSGISTTMSMQERGKARDRARSRVREGERGNTDRERQRGERDEESDIIVSKL